VSKSIPADLQAHYNTRTTTTAYALKITRTDLAVYAFTSASASAAISGVTYLAAPGLDVREFATAAGLAVDNSEITILPDAAIITRGDILAGLWNGAAWQLWRYNWADLTDGVEPICRGTLGELQPKAGAYVAELRGLQQYLQQGVGSTSSKTCRARLGDSRCTKVLTSFTHTGTLTSVTSNQVFRDSSRAEAADYFGEGTLTWTSGPSDGITAKIKTHAANGTFTLALPMHYTVAVGHTYSAVAGCRKRLDEDCTTKFSNTLNFQGEPHRPTVDALTATPEVDV